MKSYKLYISVLPLVLLILTFSFTSNTTEKSEIPVTTELNVSQQTIDNLMLESGIKVPSCSSENAVKFDCPCGGHCESDPGNICTKCSEWETQMKFVKCDSKLDTN